MRKLALSLLFASAVLAGGTGTASAQTTDLAECRQACGDAAHAFVDQCGSYAGPARGFCRRAARAYNRCCKRKFCKGRVTDVGQCIKSGV